MDVSQRGTLTPAGRPLIGPIDQVFDISFRPRSNVLAVSSVDRTIWLWDLRHPSRPQQMATLRTVSDGLLTTAFSPNGHTLVAGSQDGQVFVWDTAPESVATRVCDAVGDDITATEWAQLVPRRSYDPPCD